MIKQYAMHPNKGLVEILNDDSAKGYRVKVVKKRLNNLGILVSESPARWVEMGTLTKLTAEVVDIMVASNAI